MTNSFRINLEELRNNNLKEICDTLEAVFSEVGIDFYYLIGAQARDIWYAKEGKKSRTTKDIDFAVCIANEEQYEKVKELLQSKYQYQTLKENAFTLIAPDKTTIDLLPFGEIEVNDGVIISGLGLHSIKVNGFKEVGETGTVEVESTNQKFRIATLPSIILLKLIAFDDRPEHRQKDPEDIAKILFNYFDIETELFYDKHFDLLERIDEGKEILAARVIGRFIKEIINTNEELDKRVKSILQKHTENLRGDRFVEIISSTLDCSVERAIQLISELLIGVNEETTGINP